MYNNGDNNSNQNDDYDDDDYYYDYFGAKSEFNDYAYKTVEPGPLLLLITAIICFSVVFIIPVFLIIHHKIDACRRRRKEPNIIDADDDNNLEMINKQEGEFINNTTSTDVSNKEVNVLNDKAYEIEPNIDIISVISSSIGYNSTINGDGNTDTSRKSKRKRRRFGRFRRMLVHTAAADEGMEDMNNSPVNIASRALSDVGPCCGIVIPTACSEAAKSDGYVNRSSKKEVNNFALETNATHQSIKVPQSVVSESISPNDAVDANDIGQLSQHKHMDDGKLTCCFGSNALCRISSFSKAYQGLLNLSTLDAEMIRLIQLAIPFTVKYSYDTFIEMIFAIMLGRLVGTDALTAYTVVEIFHGTTAEFIQGVVDAGLTVISHAIGTGNNFLAGQYVQIMFILYTILSIPFMFMWWYVTYDLMIWLGFSIHLANLAQQYANIAIFIDIGEGWMLVFQSLLEVTEHENASCFSECFLGTIVIISCTILYYTKDNVTLLDFAWIDLFFQFAVLIGMWFYCAYYKKWFKPYMDGMIKTNAMKVSFVHYFVYFKANNAIFFNIDRTGMQ